MIENWFHHAGERHDISAFAVMPNHVHIMIKQRKGWPLGDIVHSWQNYSSNANNKARKRPGPLWHEDGFDRFIRDEPHFLATQRYLHQNPVTAGLVDEADIYEAGSAALLVTARAEFLRLQLG